MRAYELHGVNDLRMEDIEKPEIPSGWVLVQVKASGICSSDIPRIFTNGTYHFPTIPGHEFSGVVAACGEGVVKTGLNDLYHSKKDCSIHGFPVKFQVFLVKLLPHSLVMNTWLNQQKKAKNNKGLTTK